jgi:hypothetical protein
MTRVKVWFEEKRRIRQYETLTVGYEREIDDTQENPKVAFTLVKAMVFGWMAEALKEAQAQGGEK